VMGALALTFVGLSIGITSMMQWANLSEENKAENNTHYRSANYFRKR
jgi:hypothetical protein